MASITITATTDVHGFIDEGLANVASVCEQLSTDLLIDNGDFFVGSPFATFGYAQTKVSPLVDIANEIAYDVMVPGNHDLDFGLKWLQTQVKALNADYICANLKDATGHLVFPAYSLRSIKGVQVATIGLMTAAFNQLCSPAVAQEVIVDDPFVALEATLKKVRDLGADFVVVAYHGGLTNNPVNGDTWFYPSLEDQAYQLLEAFPSIDSLICGHQHFTQAAIHPENIAFLQVGTRAHHLGYQQFNVTELKNEIIHNQLIHLEAITYPITSDIRNAYQAWLSQSIDLQVIQHYIQTRYSAELYFVDFTATTLAELVQEIKQPFPLSLYYLPGSELQSFIEDVEEQRFYQVLAITDTFPKHRLRQEFLLPLFDEIIQNR